MIVGNVGTPGSGKSYDAVKSIISNLSKGRCICTNIDGMDDENHLRALAAVSGLPYEDIQDSFIYLKKDQVEKFWSTETHYVDGVPKKELICPRGSFIVIDEAHKHFNSRDWQSEKNRQFADWASTHRHDGYDVLLITQDIDKIDKQVRSLIEWCYYFRKINFFGGLVNNKYIVFSYMGDDHNGKPLGKVNRSYQKEVFSCYKSFNSNDVKEQSFMTHYNVLKHPIFLAIPVVIALFLWQFSKSGFSHGKIVPDYKPPVQKPVSLIQKPISSSRPLPVLASIPPIKTPVFPSRSSSQQLPISQQKPIPVVVGVLQNGKTLRYLLGVLYPVNKSSKSVIPILNRPYPLYVLSQSSLLGVFV